MKAAPGTVVILDPATKAIHEAAFTHLKARINECCDLELPWADKSPLKKLVLKNQNDASNENGTSNNKRKYIPPPLRNREGSQEDTGGGEQ